jgi:hypothetical protein
MAKVLVKIGADSYLLIKNTNGDYNVGDFRQAYYADKIHVDDSGKWVAVDGTLVQPDEEGDYQYLLNNFPQLFEGEDLVYKYMTTATNPVPQVVTNSPHHGAHAGWYAFSDRNTGYYFIHGEMFTTDPGGAYGLLWLTIDLGEGNDVNVNKISIEGAASPTANLGYGNYQFIGSHDGDWEHGDILVNVSNNTNGAGPKNHDTTDSTTKYRYFTLVVTKTTYVESTYVSVGRLYIYTPAKRLKNLTTDTGLKTYIKVA